MEAAKRARDNLAKAIYKYILQHIIQTFNGEVDPSLPFIGILDITGFGNKLTLTENFEMNIFH